MSAVPDAGVPVLVLDTNVVLDWVVFRDPGVQSMVREIESGALRPVTSEVCLDELSRALGYAALKLDAAAQVRAFEYYKAHTVPFEIPRSGEPATLPACEDPDDQKFLELAWHAGADCLVTRDKALLDMAHRVRRFRVLAPSGLAAWLAAPRPEN